MNSLHIPTVVGVFCDRAAAERAIADLRLIGILEDNIGVAARDADGTATLVTQGHQAAVGAATGAVAGGVSGTLLGVAVAAHLIPGIGPAVAGGLLGALFASAATGTLAGGAIGALIGLGIPEEEAAYYHDQLSAGNVLVTVRAGPRTTEVRSILRAYGGHDIETRDRTLAVPMMEMSGHTPAIDFSVFNRDSAAKTPETEHLPRTHEAQRLGESVRQTSDANMRSGI